MKRKTVDEVNQWQFLEEGKPEPLLLEIEKKKRLWAKQGVWCSVDLPNVGEGNLSANVK